MPLTIDHPITCSGGRHDHLHHIAAQNLTLATIMMTPPKVPGKGLRISVHQAKEESPEQAQDEERIDEEAQGIFHRVQINIAHTARRSGSSD